MLVFGGLPLVTWPFSGFSVGSPGDGAKGGIDEKDWLVRDLNWTKAGAKAKECHHFHTR